MGYTLGETIGRGSTGIVRLGIDESGKLAAIKIVPKSNKQLCERFKKEILFVFPG